MLSDFVSKEHYRIQRAARFAAGARILHVHVRPVREVCFKPFSDFGIHSTRCADDLYDYPEGVIILWSPEIPTFRAIAGHKVCYSIFREFRFPEPAETIRGVSSHLMCIDTWAWEARRSGRIGPRRFLEAGKIKWCPRNKLHDALREADRMLRCHPDYFDDMGDECDEGYL